MWQKLLLEHKDAILKRWLQLVVETYPADTAALLKREKDQFVNPVGHTISREIEALYDEILHEMNPDKLTLSLDNIARIRAVQDFSPSQAIAFVFLLKKAIREQLEGDIRRDLSFEEVWEFEYRIDKVALLAFDIYTKCREKIYEIKANELRDRSKILLERMNLMYGADGSARRWKAPASDNVI